MTPFPTPSLLGKAHLIAIHNENLSTKPRANMDAASDLADLAKRVAG